MAPLTSAEKQKLLLQQEIAKLSGAISRHATNPTSSSSTYHPYGRGKPLQRGRGGYRGAPRGLGAPRGGRGGYSLDLRATTSSFTPSAQSVPAGIAVKEDGEVEEAKEAGGAESSAGAANSWVKSQKNGNLSLMTVEKSNQLSAKPRARIPRTKVPPSIQVLSSSSTESGQRVVIDGVIFQFEQGGKKLARIGELSPSVTNGSSSTQQDTPTRKRLHYGGNKYRRTSQGNLIVKHRHGDKSTRPCKFYTKTGRCNNALNCRFSHRPDQLSICPNYLRAKCPHSEIDCPLSHTPSPHNTPSCVNFQTTSTCAYGEVCKYPHIRVSPSAPVCSDFANLGWCDKPAGTCPDLHVWECGEWRETGTCSRGGRCGLRHVLRAEKGKMSLKQAEEDGLGPEKEMAPVKGVPPEGGFEEQSEFIVLDQGSPTGVSEEEDEDMSGSESDGSDEEDDDSGKHIPSADPESIDTGEEEEQVLGVVS